MKREGKVDVVVGILTAVVGVLLGEAPLVAAITFLVVKFGLWGGFLAFTILWGGGGLLLAPIYDHLLNWLSFRFGKEEGSEGEGLRHRWIVRAAVVAKPLGALVNAVLLGPVLGIPVFRALGYQGLCLYVWTLVSAPVFGAVWVLGVYGRATSILLGGGK